jgi:hypothetical protein
MVGLTFYFAFWLIFLYPISQHHNDKLTHNLTCPQVRIIPLVRLQYPVTKISLVQLLQPFTTNATGCSGHSWLAIEADAAPAALPLLHIIRCR